MKLSRWKNRNKKPDVQKVSGAIIIFAFVELLLLAIVVLQSLQGELDFLSIPRLAATIALSALIVFDVVSAIYTARALRLWRQNVTSVEEALVTVEKLNGTLRAQRHDFLNHLQVVSGLIEMQEFSAASDYIQRISGDIQNVSRVLRTKNAAVNALLQAKYAMCQNRSIAFDVVIRTTLENLPMEDWQMCRVLSNLIDNAAEAMKEKDGTGVLRLILEEDDTHIRFTVENNGPEVPRDILPAIFNAGISTKGEGRGMGLSIVRQVMQAADGDISHERSGEWTRFCGFLPKSDI